MAGISRRVVSAGLLAVPAAALAQAQTATEWKLPTNAEIDAILARRIDFEHRGVGIVAGVIDAGGRRIVAHGSTRRTGGTPVNGDTVFEIGSMTKVFTSLLLTEAILRGEVASLDDPVARYLPANVKMPERGGKQITFADLATHTSGLPRLPTNFAPKDPNNPYADYDDTRLHAFLSSYTLTRDIGARYEYSNLAVGLLGQVLAHRAGTDYATLVRQRITGPLGMKDTSVSLSTSQTARLAAGYTGTLEDAANWDLGALARAGALRSTANDMLTFLAAVICLKPTPLKPSMDALLSVRRPTGGSMQVALGWHILAGAHEVIWHNGGTGGYRTYMGFDPKAKIGAVVLTNAATPQGGDDIGLHLLIGTPVAQLEPQKFRQAIALPVAELESLVGRYQFAPTAALIVVQRDGRLFAQLTGQPAAEIFPESSTEFFYKVVDAQIVFTRGPGGRGTDLILHQLGRHTPAKRVEP